MPNDTQMLKKVQALERDVRRRRTYVPRDDYEQSGARLENALFGLHQGGINSGPGKLRYAWRATSDVIHCSGVGMAVMTENNITDPSYRSTGYEGGPYIELNGLNQYLSIADAAWQEPDSGKTGLASCGFMVWAWCHSWDDTIDQYIVSKWDYGSTPTRMAYCLRWNVTSGNFEFAVSQDGTGATDTVATSTHAAIDVVNGDWYFVGGSYKPNSMYVYVGHSTDDIVLLQDGPVATTPSVIFDGDEPLLFGCAYNNGVASDFLSGGLGHVQMRILPVGHTEAQRNMQQIFNDTRYFYQS